MSVAASAATEATVKVETSWQWNSWRYINFIQDTTWPQIVSQSENIYHVNALSDTEAVDREWIGRITEIKTKKITYKLQIYIPSERVKQKGKKHEKNN